ncbi:hypothetical protein ACW9UR_22280 [Halovulum sp. GXIMD14794]
MTPNPFVKIDRPPTAENWTRMNYPEVDKTTRAIFRAAKGLPTWNYNVSRVAAKSRIEHRIDLPTALTMVERYKNKIGRPFNKEVVEAFFDYEAGEPIDGLPAFDDLVEAFPLRRGISIPIKPLTVVREGKHFVPLFLCPWSTVNLDRFQASLLMTVLEKSLFTLTDFEDSEGKILFFPKVACGTGVRVRRPMVWRRGQFPLLSDNELADQVRVFMESRDAARILYQDYLAAMRG